VIVPGLKISKLVERSKAFSLLFVPTPTAWPKNLASLLTNTSLTFLPLRWRFAAALDARFRARSLSASRRHNSIHAQVNGHLTVVVVTMRCYAGS